MKKSVLIIIFLISTLLTLPVYSKAGAGSSGGGDANSKRLREIRGYFTADRAKTTAALVRIAFYITKFPTVGTMSSQIHDLVQNGIIDDFKNANYELRSICKDESDLERSASTLKIDLSKNPNQERPAICINVRKLALEDASFQSIIGLLFHEHGRHFGIEDTDELSFHPMADYVTEIYDNIAQYFNSDIVNGLALSIDPDTLFIHTPINNYQAKIVIEEMSGNCDEVFAHSWRDGKEIKLDVGVELPLSGDYGNFEIDKGNAYKFIIKKNLLESSPIGFFTGVDRRCKLSYSIQSEQQKSATLVSEIHSNIQKIGGFVGAKNIMPAITVLKFSWLADKENDIEQ